MRKFVALLFILFPLLSKAQNTQVIQLGYLNGDFKVKQFDITKSLASHQSLNLASDTSLYVIEKIRVKQADTTISWSLALDLKQRIGQFSDSLVFSNANGVIAETIIVQYQILKPAEDVFKSYRNEFWPFRSREQVFNLKAGRQGDTLSATFDLYNFSGKALNLEQINMSDSMSVSFDPVIVRHHSFTRATISLLSNDSSQLGFNRVVVPVLNQNDTMAFLPIQYSILPAFAANEARIGVTRKNFDFKVVKQGDKKNEVTFLSNNGNTPIKILKVESNCECLSYDLSEDVIAPGKNVQLRVIFDAENRLGLEQKMVSVFLDSSSQPVINFVFKAHVKK